jgi:putative toxin-antitoxin system antitoxin component (TIGR02293 family)
MALGEPPRRGEEESVSLEKAYELLGGRPVLKVPPVRSRMGFVGLVRQGLPWASFEKTLEGLQLTLDDASESLKLPKRTLLRRKAKASRLAPGESERLVRLARVGARANEVFGNRQKAHTWLRSPNRALGGFSPLGLLDTDIGAQAVEDELVRIEHGVYS